MTEVIARVHSVHLVKVEQSQAAADPQTKPPDLGSESACFRQLSSTIVYYYYYCLLFAVTHAPFHVSSAEAYSWPSARDRRDREVN